MRNLLLALVCAGSLACGAAHAANNDVFELGLGARLLFDSDVYKADNPGVNYDTDFFRIVGDQAFGIGFDAALGHRFDSRRGPWEMLVKYNYSTSAEDTGVASVPSGAGNLTVDITGKLDQHDLFFTFRLPGDFLPIPLLDSKGFYYDLGLGVTTLSYDHHYDYLGTTIYSSRRTRTGMAYNLGLGWRHDLNENTQLTLRGDVVMGKIQDVEDASGGLVHASPKAHGLRAQVGLIRYFKTPF
jgi:hypothetical protein